MNMPIIVRLATKADLSNRSAAVALRDFEPLMTAVGPGRVKTFFLHQKLHATRAIHADTTV
jgi:hypothetical protein